MNSKMKVIVSIMGVGTVIVSTGVIIGLLSNNMDKFEKIAEKATKVANNTIEKWCDKIDRKLESILEKEELEEIMEG